MGIVHLKFDEIGSTQSWLKENLSEQDSKNVLVTAENQTEGVGRLGNKWSQFGKSATFSFSITPLPNITLTPLEIAVHIVEYFKKDGIELFVKWPNDIIIRDGNVFKKIGGILCHFHDKESLIVGIGLNLDPKALPEDTDFKFSPGAFKSKTDVNQELPYSIYEYILSNRLDSTKTIEEWSQICFHHSKKVKIEDSSQSIEGIFLGIGENGEALIENEGKTQKVISGSLWVL